MSATSGPMRFLRGTMRVLDAGRRIFVNLLFLVLMLVLLSLFFSGDKALQIEQGVALVLDPVGFVVEEYDADPAERAVNRALGMDVPQVLLRDLSAALKFAADDDRIDTIVLDLSGLAPVSLSKLSELTGPLALARSRGKHILAYAESYSQSQYMLAAHADEIHLHPLGMVYMDGYASYRTYMREALEKLSVDWNIFKAGDYKSFGEPYERDSMSPQVREETAEWLNAMWVMYMEAVEGARGLEPGAVTAYIDGTTEGLASARGNFARYAESVGLVDALTYESEFVEHVVARVGTDGDSGYRGVHWQAYLGARRSERAPMLATRDQIGLLVARGSIVEGDPGLQVMGSARIVSLIDDAIDDDRIKALVLRVDSGGGSPLASEDILVALKRFRESGRPLVVSMGGVAASGGYWISTVADEIWATPATITGSIGVIGMFPTVPRALERLGLRVDGVGTTRYSGAFRVDRPLSDDVANLIQLSVDGIYTDFLDRVSEGRDMEVSAVDAIGGGRVYLGTRAREIGLVDEIGGLDDAVAAGARLAGLEAYAVRLLQREQTFRERLLTSMLTARIVDPVVQVVARANNRPLQRWARMVERELSFVTGLSDARHAYLYCLCEAP